ncbi:hypothetical protein [Bradyrhizobium sp. RD5-C2]|uniref:hypothetical protein n=1 Tax=Bradyrhizobium sp. RD5-C2 TaxID=244562 RepID=UPI001CC4230B|nr:hypothetical protein [Bradyrhizobium sp. RD5-C2]GIQ75504.1 hypothetical protein BraRD5C2_39450 [Bradyrhizobium sp. RD5-C2]
MYKDAIIDELRQIELAVVEGERWLAEQEALLVELQRSNQDISTARAELEVMRKNQLDQEQNRQRLLSLLHP